MYFGYFDPLYLLLGVPPMLLAIWASWRTRSVFKKYSRVRTARGLTGAEAAAAMLRGAGVDDVEIVPTGGMLTDHYNPMTKRLALSEGVYGSSSVAAVGVACHEAGHAVQHARSYRLLWLRSALVPTAGIGSNVGIWVMIAGLFLRSPQMVLFGAIVFSTVLVFQVVTLPVEIDASARAKRLAVENGIVLPQEREGMDRVLNAAALTYVAAVISSLMTLLYFLMRAGLLGGGRRD